MSQPLRFHSKRGDIVWDEKGVWMSEHARLTQGWELHVDGASILHNVLVCILQLFLTSGCGFERI
jgi:hypothetical protein